MKKILIVGILAAAAVGGYWVYQQKGSPINSNKDNVLSHIPADTAIFAAQFKPFPIKKYIDSGANLQKQVSSKIETIKKQAKTPKAKFFAEILSYYVATAKDGQTFINTFGLPAKISTYFYTLGAIPVLKFDIANPDKLWALLDKAESTSGFSHETNKVGNISYRSYLLTEANAKENIKLLLAANNGMLTATLATNFSDPSLIGIALGVTPVANPLDESGIIKGIFSKYNFTKDGLSFIDYRRIVTALTTKDGNMMATQLNRIFSIENQDPLKTLRSKTCHAELNAIAANWPRTVSGYTTPMVENKPADVSTKIIIETKNQPILGALKSIRGSIPAYTQDSKNTMLALGLGINVDALAPAITNIWQELTTPTYQCSPLNALQAKIKQNNPATLAMFTGTVRELRGVSMSLINYSFVDNNPDKLLKSLDAIVSFSAKNPANLYNKIKSFLPGGLAKKDLPTDGSAIDLTGQTPLGSKVKINMAIKGDHLVVYSGTTGNKIAQDIAAEPLSSNGIFALTIDYGKLLSSLSTIPAMKIPQDFNFKDYNFKVKVNMDVDDNGIVFNYIQKSSNL